MFSLFVAKVEASFPGVAKTEKNELGGPWEDRREKKKRLYKGIVTVFK